MTLRASLIAELVNPNRSVEERAEICCELSKDFENNGTSISDVFMELLPAVVEAHKTNDTNKLLKIYGFAEWCFNQKHKDLWNSAGVMFYEHLGDYEETRKDMSKWVKPSIYKDIKGLLELRLDDKTIKKIDEIYKATK